MDAKDTQKVGKRAVHVGEAKWCDEVSLELSWEMQKA